MKYKIWDRINKRYDETKWIDQGGKMLGFSYCSEFDRDDFEVQWVKEPGDDMVDPKIWEDFKRTVKKTTGELMDSLCELKSIITNAQSQLICIIDENKC